MKPITRLLTVFIIVLTVGQGCNDDTGSPYDYGTIWKCNQKNKWDLESTQNAIIGRWEWKYIRCCGESSDPYENNTKFKGLKIEFKNDGTGSLTENNVVEEFTWEIGTSHLLYGFTTEPFLSQLNGQLLFCDDIMMCNNSVVDGADNFFKKSD